MTMELWQSWSSGFKERSVRVSPFIIDILLPGSLLSIAQILVIWCQSNYRSDTLQYIHHSPSMISKQEGGCGNSTTPYCMTIQKVLEIKLHSPVKKQYAVPVYNLEKLHRLPNKTISFTFNDQLFLLTLPFEIRG